MGTNDERDWSGVVEEFSNLNKKKKGPTTNTELTRISDEIIAKALEKQKMFKGMDLSKAIDRGDRLTAQAQLEADKSKVEAIRKEEYERGLKDGEKAGLVPYHSKKPRW